MRFTVPCCTGFSTRPLYQLYPFVVVHPTISELVPPLLRNLIGAGQIDFDFRTGKKATATKNAASESCLPKNFKIDEDSKRIFLESEGRGPEDLFCKPEFFRPGRGGGGYFNMFEGTGTCHYLGVPFF